MRSLSKSLLVKSSKPAELGWLDELVNGLRVRADSRGYFERPAQPWSGLEVYRPVHSEFAAVVVWTGTGAFPVERAAALLPEGPVVRFGAFAPKELSALGERFGETEEYRPA